MADDFLMMLFTIVVVFMIGLVLSMAVEAVVEAIARRVKR